MTRDQAEIIVQATRENGGAAYNAALGRLARHKQDALFFVSIFPDRTQKVAGLPTTEQIMRFAWVNRDILGDPTNYLGTWVDDSGATWLDVSMATPHRNFAEFAAREYNQAAIFDLAAGVVINTGGTGEPLDVMLIPRERLTRLREDFASLHLFTIHA